MKNIITNNMAASRNTILSSGDFRTVLKVVSRVQPEICGCCDILDTMQIIAKTIHEKTTYISGYNTQRKILKDLFERTSGVNYSKDCILIRLTALNALYSTNASMSYFAIEDIADLIWLIPGNGTKEDNANCFFKDVAEGCILASNGVNVDFWFNKHFGMQKNCREGYKKTSLLSKYAYYCLLIEGGNDGFPIYDSLAIASFPFVFRILWPTTISDNDLESIVNIMSSNTNSQKYIPMSLYVQAINTLCEGLGINKKAFFGLQKYDIMDAYLWRMGKFSNGNFSLVLDKCNYEKIMCQLCLSVDDPLEIDSDYFKRLCEKTYYQSCINKTINDLFSRGVNNQFSYPTIHAREICKKKLLNKTCNKTKISYSGDINALTLYSLMTKKQNCFTLADKKTEQYVNSLYKHWRKYYNR